MNAADLDLIEKLMESSPVLVMALVVVLILSVRYFVAREIIYDQRDQKRVEQLAEMAREMGEALANNTAAVQELRRAIEQGKR